ncbi:hypothetical protein AKG09_10540 [Neisseria sp. 83E34]|nr:hypothetical protein AKG09_10540 [Neisseria sp. 83E34]
MEPLPPPKEGGLIRITVKSWDLRYNGGYGIYGLRKQVPVFVLGQCLTDRTRVPEIGDVLQGYLTKHENQHWMLTEISIIDKVNMPDEANLEEERLAAELRYAGSSYAGRVYAARKKQDQPSFIPPVAPVDKSKQQIKENMVFPAFMSLRGHIVKWDDEKGFGFIQSGAEDKQVFFHIKAFHYTKLRPKEGQLVSFYCNKPISEARQQAVRVVLSEHEEWLYCDVPYEMGEADDKVKRLLLAVPIVGAYFYWVYTLSLITALFYALISLIAMTCYHTDKCAALQNATLSKSEQKRRIPESTLHFIGLIGGWPGGLLARVICNHKTSKQNFITMFWLVVLANIAITYTLLIFFAKEPMLAFLRN